MTRRGLTLLFLAIGVLAPSVAGAQTARRNPDSTPGIDAAIALLESGTEVEHRRAAAAALASTAERPAIRALLRALAQDSAPEVRIQVTRSLRTSWSRAHDADVRAIVHGLREAIRDPDQDVARAAWEAFDWILQRVPPSFLVPD